MPCCFAVRQLNGATRFSKELEGEFQVHVQDVQCVVCPADDMTLQHLGPEHLLTPDCGCCCCVSQLFGTKPGSRLCPFGLPLQDSSAPRCLAAAGTASRCSCSVRNWNLAVCLSVVFVHPGPEHYSFGCGVCCCKVQLFGTKPGTRLCPLLVFRTRTQVLLDVWLWLLLLCGAAVWHRSRAFRCLARHKAPSCKVGV